LNFPNPTRSYDERRHAVRFVGHDGLFEIPFFVEAAALARNVEPGSAEPGNVMSEAKCLWVFDGSRALILNAARTAYAGGRLRSYTLSVADFR
jgi:hypothetical protein